MKIKHISFALILSSFFICLYILSLNTYKLSDLVLSKSISSEAHLNLLREPLQFMMNKEYSSKLDFINDFKLTFNTVNEANKKAQAWDKVIYNNYTFSIVKAASDKHFMNHSLSYLSYVFIPFVLGIALYFLLFLKEKKAGINNDFIFKKSLNSRGLFGISLGIVLIAFYIVLYFYPEYISNWVILLDPLSYFLNGSEASQWFLYGTLYTLAIVVMGLRFLIKYRHSRYQQLRTLSVMFFQTISAYLLVNILQSMQLPAVDLKNMWPLDYSFFFDYRIDSLVSSGKFGLVVFVWGIALFLIIVPIMTYFFGKRWYCSWICGCGGLAETMGDPFRQLSDKTLKAWKIERYSIYSVLIFAIVMTVAVLYAYFTKETYLLGINTYDIRGAYGFYIGAIFSGVVGTGFYPLMGSRVWCRFGCPLAAYMGIIQRFKSRFRITVNGGQCISCGNCSTYCEMGIDVRAYAQKGEDFVRASCVGCGVCSSVCPRGVLKLENVA